MSEFQDNLQTTSGQSEIQNNDTHAEETTVYNPHPSLPVDIQQCSEYRMEDDTDADGDDEADDDDDDEDGFPEMCDSTQSLQFALSASSEGGNGTDASQVSDPFYWDREANRRRAGHVPFPTCAVRQGGNIVVYNRISESPLFFSSSSPSSSVETFDSLGVVFFEEDEDGEALERPAVVLVADNRSLLVKWLKAFWGAFLGIFWGRVRK